jgi:hypothetical protein
MAGLYIIGIIAMLTPLLIVSDGTYWKHLLLYQNTIDNINVANFLLLFSAFVYPLMILLVLAFIYVRRDIAKKNYTWVSMFLVISLIVNMVLTFRPGSGCQFYFETLVAVCICSVLVLPHMINYVKRVRANYKYVALVCVVALVFTIGLPLRNSSFPDKQYTQSINIVQDIMSDSDKPVITENPAIALNMGKDLYMEYFIFTNLHRLGYWDENPYLQKYKEQYFDYVLLRVSLEERLENIAKGEIDGHFTNDVIIAIRDNYTLIYETINRSWPYSVFLYEANDKLENDEREIVRDFKNLDSYPTWDNGEWVWRNK